MTTVTLNIPDNLYEQLQRQALVNKQSVDELAQQTLNRNLLVKTRKRWALAGWHPPE